MNHRNFILAGLALAVFAIAFTFGSILLNFPKILVLMVVVVLWYAYAAIRWTHPQTNEDSQILHRGVKWGAAIGGTCAAMMMLGFMFSEESAMLAVVAALLCPFVVGASEAIRTGRVRMGIRAGVWSGMVGGLIGFLLFASSGYLRAWLSGAGVFAYMASNEFGAMQLATYTLILYGPIFCPVAATVGGWIGIQLEKTGRTSPAADPPIASRP